MCSSCGEWLNKWNMTEERERSEKPWKNGLTTQSEENPLYSGTSTHDCSARQGQLLPTSYQRGDGRRCRMTQAFGEVPDA